MLLWLPLLRRLFDAAGPPLVPLYRASGELRTPSGSPRVGVPAPFFASGRVALYRAMVSFGHLQGLPVWGRPRLGSCLYRTVVSFGRLRGLSVRRCPRLVYRSARVRRCATHKRLHRVVVPALVFPQSLHRCTAGLPHVSAGAAALSHAAAGPRAWEGGFGCVPAGPGNVTRRAP